MSNTKQQSDNENCFFFFVYFHPFLLFGRTVHATLYGFWFIYFILSVFFCKFSIRCSFVRLRNERFFQSDQ